MLSLVLVLGLASQTGIDPEPQPEMGYHRIVTSEGLHISVRGWIKPGGRKVTWYPDDPFNVKAVEEARASRESRSARSYAVNGVQRETKQEETYTLPSEEAREFVAGIKPDHARYWGDDKARSVHVTVIGSEAERIAVIKDIDNLPEFAGIREHILVQGYNPGEWAVDPALGFQPGSPAILVQLGKSESDPVGGKVIYRATDYSGGPAPIINAIRKANPSYNPELDPSQWLGSKCPIGLTKTDGAVAAVVAAFVWLCSLFGKKE